MATTHHYHLAPMLPGYQMFSYFSFRDGKLHVGQCESVKDEDVPAAVLHLETKMGDYCRTRATYRYVDGRAVLVAE